MKFLLKVCVMLVLGMGVANANILSEVMKLSQGVTSNHYSNSSDSSTRWVKVSIPDGVPDAQLTEKLAEYPSIAVQYLQQHETRINGVQNTIYSVLINTKSQNQYVKYGTLAKTLGMNQLPPFKGDSNNFVDNMSNKIANVFSSSNSSSSGLSEVASSDSGMVKVPGLY